MFFFTCFLNRHTLIEEQALCKLSTITFCFYMCRLIKYFSIINKSDIQKKEVNYNNSDSLTNIYIPRKNNKKVSANSATYS
jgi:hypothetical protein